MGLHASDVVSAGHQDHAPASVRGNMALADSVSHVHVPGGGLPPLVAC
jgi:hypothetical protein